MLDFIRRTEGCLKNSYHVTALQNAGECNECFKLLAKAFMVIFNINMHVDIDQAQ
jgi:hypothetical protein